MSTENTGTEYTLYIQALYGGGSLIFSESDNWNDEVALAVAVALSAVEWPEGGSFQVSKAVTDAVTTVATPSAAPPAFE